jgi:tetratricopeptide (TPR) repeat protein
MKDVLRLAGFGLGFVISTMLTGSPLLVDTAHAADEEERRVLRAADINDGSSQGAEYRRLAEEARLESIRRLKSLLSEGVEGDRKAEMMLRLADLYFQQGRELHLSEMEAYTIAFDECFNDDNCDSTKMQPDNSVSHSWQAKSIKLYESILRNYPRYARADQATYYMGVAWAELKEPAKALEAYKKLVKLYPQSGFVPDAFVLIGEHYFEDNNAYAALRAYLKATTFKESEQYPFAMYKLAWCYYNVGEYGKGIDTMKTVVAYSMEQSADNTGLALHEEALRDLVQFFADAGAMDEAYEYFIKLGKKELIYSMLRRLGGMYFSQGKFEQSIETYRRLILEDPQSSKNAGYQEDIIKAYRKMGQKDRVLEEIDRLRNDYGINSAWARANASDADSVNEAQTVIEKVLRQTAAEYHEEARTLSKSRHSRSSDAYELAYQAYSVYLGDYPDNTHSYEVRYAFAELLWDTKRYDEAYGQYMNVVKIDPQGKRSRFCAEGAIFAAEEMVKNEGGLKSGKMEQGKAREAIDLTAWEQNLVDASAQYASLYPGDAKIRGILYKAAYMLYHKYRFGESGDLFRKVIKLEPSSKDAMQAAHLILTAFTVTEDWNNLKLNAKFFWEQEGLGSKTFKQEMYDIYQKSSFKVIEINLGKDEDYNAAADAFVAFYEEFPEADVAAQALNNAAVYYFKEDRVADSTRVRHILVEDEKFGDKTPYYYDQVAQLGFNYEQIADFEKAAYYYDLLYSIYPEQREKLEKQKKKKGAPEDLDAKISSMDETASAALYSSALFRNAMGQWEQAVDGYTRFIADFPSDSRVREVQLTIGNIYEEHEQWTQAANTFFNFYDSIKKGEDVPLEFVYFARLHQGRALIELGKDSKAAGVYEQTVKMYEKYIADGGEVGTQTEMAAEMMFVLAQNQFETYLELEVQNSGQSRNRKKEDKAIGDSLTAKKGALLEQESTYGGIIETGAGEWGLAALINMGRAYEDMGGTLIESPNPYYLTDDQIEMYRMGIEDLVYGQEEKAIAAYKLALEKSFELTLYNDNTAFATRRLGELRPDDFPGLEEQLLQPGYISSEIRTFDVETEYR